jgi:hypothetical protein
MRNFLREKEKEKSTGIFEIILRGLNFLNVKNKQHIDEVYKASRLR